jgi:hypothetical protein
MVMNRQLTKRFLVTIFSALVVIGLIVGFSAKSYLDVQKALRSNCQFFKDMQVATATIPTANTKILDSLFSSSRKAYLDHKCIGVTGDPPPIPERLR